MRGGLKAIYCSGWQVAGDANTAGDVYPDQSLYPANAVPELVRKLNKVCCCVSSSVPSRACSLRKLLSRIQRRLHPCLSEVHSTSNHMRVHSLLR